MGDILSEVVRWRANAYELRATSEALTNAVARDSLSDIADGYDRLADDIEDVAAKQLARAV